MIISRTSYPWTAHAVLFRQKIGVGNLTYDIEVDAVGSDKNMILVREYVDGNIRNIYRYVYSRLLGFIGPVCEVFRTDFGVDLCFAGKFFVDGARVFDSTNYD